MDRFDKRLWCCCCVTLLQKKRKSRPSFRRTIENAGPHSPRGRGAKDCHPTWDVLIIVGQCSLDWGVVRSQNATLTQNLKIAHAGKEVYR